jgi:hypothetical protein
VVVLGWIIWALACVFAFQYAAITLCGLLGRLPYRYKTTPRPLALKVTPLICILAGLCTTAFADVSKLHLLWIVPAGYGVSVVLSCFFWLLARFGIWPSGKALDDLPRQYERTEPSETP